MSGRSEDSEVSASAFEAALQSATDWRRQYMRSHVHVNHTCRECDCLTVGASL